ATAWFGSIFGRRRFLLTCIVLFTLASAACGAAGSLGLLIAARVLQGVGGGALQPIAQALLLESFPPPPPGLSLAPLPPSRRPARGGVLPALLRGRWFFTTTPPLGVPALLRAYAFVGDPPYIGRGEGRALDYAGFGLLAVWLGTAQVVFDKGQQDDWFAAAWI